MCVCHGRARQLGAVLNAPFEAVGSGPVFARHPETVLLVADDF